MGKQERRTYLQAIKPRYRQSHRAAKQTIQNEFCKVCGYARKHASRLLIPKMKSAATQPSGPSPAKISVQGDTGALEAHLFHHRSTVLQALEGGNTHLVAALRKNSTVWSPIRLAPICGRCRPRPCLLKPLRVQHPKGLSGTKSRSLLKTQIQIRTHRWEETQRGFIKG